MKDIFVILFSESGLDRSAQGLIGAGRDLANASSSQLKAVVIGSPNEKLSSDVSAFADEVLVLSQPELHEYQCETYLQALTLVLSELEPQAVLFGNDSYSQDLAARLSYRLRGSSTGDCAGVEFANGNLRVSRQVYGGKAKAVIELKRAPAVVWLRSRSFDPAPAISENGQIREITLLITSDNRTKLVEKQRADHGNARLEDARVIVSGGRGIGGSESFIELQNLATVLEGQMAASRAVCDAGWVPPSWQVGQTGKKVSPDLYLAIAISGASQHLAGISEAKVIAAINTDRDAPIFKHCQFGIVEDYKKVVPLLRNKIAELKSG